LTSVHRRHSEFGWPKIQITIRKLCYVNVRRTQYFHASRSPQGGHDQKAALLAEPWAIVQLTPKFDAHLSVWAGVRIIEAWPPVRA